MRNENQESQNSSLENYNFSEDNLSRIREYENQIQTTKSQYLII